MRKLGFLKHTVRDGAIGVGAVAMRAMVDDVTSLCLVRECRALEEGFGSLIPRLTPAYCIIGLGASEISVNLARSQTYNTIKRSFLSQDGKFAETMHVH